MRLLESRISHHLSRGIHSKNLTFRTARSFGCFRLKKGRKKIDIIYEKFPSLMINDHQSPMDKMLVALNEKKTYQQCIDGVLTKYDKFLNGYSQNIMKFLICGRIPTASKSSMLLWLMFLGIVICRTPLFTRQINYAKPCLLTWKTLTHYTCSRIDYKTGISLNVHVKFAQNSTFCLAFFLKCYY